MGYTNHIHSINEKSHRKTQRLGQRQQQQCRLDASQHGEVYMCLAGSAWLQLVPSIYGLNVFWAAPWLIKFLIIIPADTLYCSHFHCPTTSSTISSNIGIFCIFISVILFMDVVYYVYYMISTFIPKRFRTMFMTCLDGPKILLT